MTRLRDQVAFSHRPQDYCGDYYLFVVVIGRDLLCGGVGDKIDKSLVAEAVDMVVVQEMIVREL